MTTCRKKDLDAAHPETRNLYRVRRKNLAGAQFGDLEGAIYSTLVVQGIALVAQG